MEEFLQILGGTTVVLGTLFTVLGKAAIARIIESERKRTESELSKLRKELEKSVHIGKEQFDLEFKIYQEAWEKLVFLKKAALGLRPILDHVDPNEQEEERKRRRLKDFGEAFNEYYYAIEASKPFYSESVYEMLSHIMKSAKKEMVCYQYHNDNSMEGWEQAEKNQDEIVDLIEKACIKIRERIRDVQVF